MRSTRPGSCFACASFLFDLPYLPDQLVKLALYLEGIGSLFGRGRGIVGRGLVVPWRRRGGGVGGGGGQGGGGLCRSGAPAGGRGRRPRRAVCWPPIPGEARSKGLRA